MSHSVVCYYPAGKRKARLICEDFAAGAHGAAVPDASAPFDGPAAFYGVHDKTRRLFDAVRRDGRRWWYIDNAYLHPGDYFRVTEGALQSDGRPVEADLEEGRRRLARLSLRLAPWRRTGGHVLITPPGDTFLRLTGQAITSAEWQASVIAALREATDRPLRVRLKPAPRDRRRPLAADLAGAWCLVTHQSNTAVEALVAGVPAFVTGRCAAQHIAETDLGLIEQPRIDGDREEWAAMLAAHQFTRAEMRQGACWAWLTRNG